MGTRVYGISNPTFRPVLIIVALAYAAALITAVLRSDLDWALYLFPTLLLVPLAYLLHRAGVGWIRIHDREIDVTPSWFSRKLWGEPTKTARFDTGSELLFCVRYAYRAPDGFSIILRSPSVPDTTLWNSALNPSGVSRAWWSRIAQQMNQAHGLTTRLIQRNVTDQGISELDWPSGRFKRTWRAVVFFVFAAVAPWLGIGVRLLTADPMGFVLSGVALWACVLAGTWYWVRTIKTGYRTDLTSRMLVFTLQFATFYALAVLVTNAVLRH